MFLISISFWAWCKNFQLDFTTKKVCLKLPSLRIFVYKFVFVFFWCFFASFLNSFMSRFPNPICTKLFLKKPFVWFQLDLHNIFLFQCPYILRLFGWFLFMSFFCYFCVFLCLSFIYVFIGDPIASRFIIGDHNVFLISYIMLFIEIMQEYFLKLCLTIDF